MSKDNKTTNQAPREYDEKNNGLSKPKNAKETLFRLLNYLKPRNFKLLSVFILAIFGTAFAVYGPKVMGDAITVLFDGVSELMQNIPGAAIDFSAVGRLLLLLAGLYILSSVFLFFQTYIMASVAQGTVYDLREAVFEKMNKLPLKYFDEKSYGDTLSRVTNDLDLIGTTLQQSLTQFITSFVRIIGILIMMLWISPLLTIITVVSIPVSLFIIKPLLKKSQMYFARQQNRLGALNGHIEEMYTNHEVVTAFGREETSINKFTEVNSQLFESGKKAQFISGIIMPLMTFVGNISYVLISIIGGILVTQRAISIGDIQAFLTYSKQLSQPITQTANIANIIQSTIAAAERVFEFLDAEEEIDTGTVRINPENKVGTVEFKDVTFGYGKEPLIQHLNLSVEAGETIAIVGPTGAGKTTLINLILRFYELDSGQILIDDIDITKLSRQTLREQFGIVLQDTWLFNGSIKDNIAYGKKGVTDEAIYNAAKTARADEFIHKLPDGYETILNEEASNISTGQKQLITIARAILSDAPMMILDEATSSVDTRTEILIQEAMNNLMKDRTNFVIAHRLSTIKDADVILVMDQGNVIEQGTHDELLKLNGFYADLYNSQFSEKAI